MAKAGSGSAKGAEFERHVCKLLSKWVTAGARSDVFWRTSMSGGRATVARKKGESLRQAGDIASVAPEGHQLTDKLYFELKFYRNLELTNFFIRQKGTLANFWNKTVEEAWSYDKSPVLIVKQDRIPSLLIASLGVLDLYVPKPLPSRAVVIFPRLICTVYQLDDVLSVPFKRKVKRIRM